MEGWVDLGYPAVHRPGVELAIFWSLVRRPTTTLPSQPCMGGGLWNKWVLSLEWLGRGWKVIWTEIVKWHLARHNHCGRRRWKYERKELCISWVIQKIWGTVVNPANTAPTENTIFWCIVWGSGMTRIRGLYPYLPMTTNAPWWGWQKRGGKTWEWGEERHSCWGIDRRRPWPG